SQYRGTLLGAALGQVLGANAQAQTQTDWQQIERWGFGLPVPHHPTPDLPHDSLHDPIAKLGQPMLSLGDGVIHQPQQSIVLPSAILGHPSTLAIATLPITLYAHNHPKLLRSHLERLSAPVSSLAVALAVGELISQVMHTDQPPPALIEGAIAAQDLILIAPELAATLQRVNVVADQDSLAIARHSLLAETPADYVPLCLALYCFLSTPEHPAIVLLRAAQISPLPLTCALAGALCGARNGISSLPATWRVQAQQSGSITALWGVSESALDSLAAMLFAAWAGIYMPSLRDGKLPHPAWVVAPAGKLRPR
ncbi:MAG: ADP-ribosylglycohydrolase family protein, partial [Cyanobacteriota bacterium]